MDAQKLAQVVVDVAHGLVQAADVHVLLHELTRACRELLNTADAGILLADRRGRLHVLAASSEAGRLLDLLAQHTSQGPASECYRTGRPVRTGPPAEGNGHPYAPGTAAAVEEATAGTVAVPLRLHGEVLGALLLFSGPGSATVTDQGLILAQAMADLATALVMGSHPHAAAHPEQLDLALGARVVIDQAKATQAARLGLDLDDAFELLRARAADRGTTLADVAAEVTAGRWAGHVHQ